MIQPLRDNALIISIKDPDTWYGSSIIRPDSTKSRAVQGIVKALGPECRELRVGDYVLFPSYSGTVVADDLEGDHIMVPEKGVTAKITPPTTMIPKLWIEAESGMTQATAEAVMMMIREVYESLPRVVEVKEHVKVEFTK